MSETDVKLKKKNGKVYKTLILDKIDFIFKL